ncbi:hypothetical protein QQ045_010500 [Rhodiola kirilowii]
MSSVLVESMMPYHTATCFGVAVIDALCQQEPLWLESGRCPNVFLATVTVSRLDKGAELIDEALDFTSSKSCSLKSQG